MDHRTPKRTRAQESSNAIERLYISMRHLFSRGFYKPMGVSGETLLSSLLLLRPEIYGSIAEDKIELNGLHYVVDRLPLGIESCQYIQLTSEEGFKNAHFTPLVPLKRRRSCYRIDKDMMSIVITRGRSDIYDILTHITFLYIEAYKIKKRVYFPGDKEVLSRSWQALKQHVVYNQEVDDKTKEVLFIHLGDILGRSFNEIQEIYTKFATPDQEDRFFHFVYWLGYGAIAEETEGKEKLVTFSEKLREEVGHHIYGERWASNIKNHLLNNQLENRPIHVISANMHSVLNTLYASEALNKQVHSKGQFDFELYETLSKDESHSQQDQVLDFAHKNGLISVKDQSGTNIDVQLIDTKKLPNTIKKHFKVSDDQDPVIIVMDYAFGEQAYETMEELLKPLNNDGKRIYFNIESVSIMGKAGILEGGKGDIMIPNAHIYEGTADNYPFKNELTKTDFDGLNQGVYEGTMISVLGTSLQNKDILKFFHESSWNVIGLEMEGAHYQKAIQAASKIRGNVSKDIKVRYAYYASDNPLETGSTLASGGLGKTGVKPTYAITFKILEQILQA